MYLTKHPKTLKAFYIYIYIYICTLTYNISVFLPTAIELLLSPHWRPLRTTVEFLWRLCQSLCSNPSLIFTTTYTVEIILYFTDEKSEVRGGKKAAHSHETGRLLCPCWSLHLTGLVGHVTTVTVSSSQPRVCTYGGSMQGTFQDEGPNADDSNRSGL